MGRNNQTEQMQWSSMLLLVAAVMHVILAIAAWKIGHANGDLPAASHTMLTWLLAATGLMALFAIFEILGGKRYGWLTTLLYLFTAQAVLRGVLMGLAIGQGIASYGWNDFWLGTESLGLVALVMLAVVYTIVSVIRWREGQQGK